MDIAKTATELLKSGESFVYATILKSQGSTPRGAGTGMIIRQNGAISGTVGGGALEGSVITVAAEVLRRKSPQVLSFRLDGKDAMTQGAVCGGSASVLVDYIAADNPANLEFYTALSDAMHRCTSSRGGIARIGCARIVTVLPDGVATRHQCLLLPDGGVAGHGGVDPAVIGTLREKGGRYDVYTSLEQSRIFLHAVGGDGTAYIFGAGHCGEKLAHILATVGFRLVIIDDREEFANAGRFPDADEIIVPAAMDTPFNTLDIGADGYIVIVTRGHRHDEIVLRGALKTNAGYIGMIGSKSKRETIYRNIRADGFTQEEIDRVYSPIGLPIDADSPEEIAISIAAEMIKVRAGKRNLALTD